MQWIQQMQQAFSSPGITMSQQISSEPGFLTYSISCLQNNLQTSHHTLYTGSYIMSG